MARGPSASTVLPIASRDSVPPQANLANNVGQSNSNSVGPVPIGNKIISGTASSTKDALGIASMEQIRDYNTRLQLLNAQEANVSDSKNGSDERIHYDESATTFDVMTSTYSQEEVLLKEMKFLLDRLKDLQELNKKNTQSQVTKKRPYQKLDEDKLDHNKDNKLSVEEKKSSEKKSEEFVKQLTLSFQQEQAAGSSDSVDVFKDIEPEFLDKHQLLTILNNVSNENDDKIPLEPMQNKTFHINFLIRRDPYLVHFYQKIYGVIESNFRSDLDTWKDEFSKMSLLVKTDGTLKFPSRELTQELIGRYVATVAETSSLIPIFKPKELMVSVEQHFGREPLFTVVKLNMGQLLTLGNITLCLLLTFESLTSTVLIPLKDEALTSFATLRKWIPQLKSNLEMVKVELETRQHNTESVDVLNFVALYKYYNMISTTYTRLLDVDEDVHMIRNLSVNCEKKNQETIALWNFVYKNYCWRHLYYGEVPNLVSGPELNSSVVIDPLLNIDISLLNFQIEFVKYLHSNDELISITKLNRMKEIFRLKLNDHSKRCFTTSSIIHSVMDALIYRNTILFIDYYLLLQYEKLDDTTKFLEVYDEILQVAQESLFYIFSNLASLKFAGSEFIFANKSFTTLNNICHMFLGLYFRARAVLDDPNNTSNQNNYSAQQQSTLLMLLLQKIMMLLKDYSKNLKVPNPVITKLTTAISTITEYVESDEAESIQSEKNIFKLINQSELSKDIQKLHGISESLIKSDFYNQRTKFIPTKSKTLGITSQNFTNVYESLFCR